MRFVALAFVFAVPGCSGSESPHPPAQHDVVQVMRLHQPMSVCNMAGIDASSGYCTCEIVGQAPDGSPVVGECEVTLDPPDPIDPSLTVGLDGG